jgi:uncharacterized protein (TIGR00369 family)
MVVNESKREMVAALENIIKVVSNMGMRIEEFERGLVKVRLPKEPNMNHVGAVYAGSLFSLADFAGSILCSSCFDLKQYYPVIKESSITFKRPATTDVIIETSLSPEEIAVIRETADSEGKADFVKEFDLKDGKGNICCVARGSFQLCKA